MRLGIDASNIRGLGGGVIHLIELLRAAEPQEHGFSEVIVWGGRSTLSQLGDFPWLRKAHDPLLDQPLPLILFWQRAMLDHLVRREDCDVLFVPGGTYVGAFRPYVAMSQNLLPFEWSEARRYGVSWWTLKLMLLHYSQLATFKKADGLIFLTNYMHGTVGQFLGRSTAKVAVIPHGVNDRFRQEPKLQKPIHLYSNESPIRVLYVSPIAPYKHQWHVMDAVWQLRRTGLPVTLDLVGPIRNCRTRFLRALAHFDPQREWIRYHGEVPYRELYAVYHQADVFVFASSCETISITLLEAMSAGLPIACSNRGPMPEVLGDAGVYFDPERPSEIAEAIQTLLGTPSLREQKARDAYERAKVFTWERCACDTFGFFAQVANERPQ